MKKKELLHPKGAHHLFFAELFERFSYYGITALMILFLYFQFGVAEKTAYYIYGVYATLVYASPIFGGFLSPRYLGFYHAVVLGSISIIVGHFIMMVPYSGDTFFYLGLGFVILGTGLFKPNIANLISILYDKVPHLKERGFTVAHVYCNIGGALASILCAYIALKVGYLLAFGISGVTMLIGLLILIMGRRFFKVEPLKFQSFVNIILTLIILVLLSMQVFYHHSVVDFILAFSFLVAIFAMVKSALSSDSVDRKNIFSVMMLFIPFLIFMVFLQISGGPLNLFTAQYVNRSLFGKIIPAGAFQAVEPIAFVVLGAIFVAFRNKKYVNKKFRHYARWFAFSLIFQGLSFLLLLIAICFEGESISMLWINGTYTLQAMGEVLIAPISLEMISKFIPIRFSGIFMGTWILIFACANFIASRLGSVIAIETVGEMASVESYFSLFKYLMVIGILCGLFLLLGALVVKKFKHRKTIGFA